MSGRLQRRAVFSIMTYTAVVKILMNHIQCMLLLYWVPSLTQRAKLAVRCRTTKWPELVEAIDILIDAAIAKRNNQTVSFWEHLGSEKGRGGSDVLQKHR